MERRLVRGELRESVVDHHGIDFATEQTASAGRYRVGKRQMASRDLQRNRLVNAAN